jgi:creatinine amidohydrolase
MIDERQFALARMTSPEAAEALGKAEVAISPVGATEQHGPNLTLENDSAIARGLALRIADATFPRAVVTPAVTFGLLFKPSTLR